jgi:hypothetical protein
MGVPGDRLRVTFSRPYGTCRLSNLYPGLRPGLSSAVPAGLILQSVGSHTRSLVRGVHVSNRLWRTQPRQEMTSPLICLAKRTSVARAELITQQLCTA